MNSIWFLGDDFLEKTYGKYFQGPNFDNGFIRGNYTSTGLEKWNRSYLGRIKNALVKGINDNQCILPRYIIVVMDNELIEAIRYVGYGYKDVYVCMLEWFARQCDRVLRSAKDYFAK